jgi:hypothetical protein
MLMRRFIAAVACTVWCAASASAQGGKSAAVFLELPTSPRALAMGESYTAVGDDDATLFFNPAQLASRHTASAGLSVQHYLLASTLAAFSAAGHFGPGMAGLGIQVLDYGSEPELVPDENYGGQRGIPTGADITAGDIAVTAGYGVERGRVRVGAAAKFVRQRIADASGSAVAGDVGVALSLPRHITIAAAAQHLGGDLTLAGTSSALPRTLRAGLAAPLITRDRVSVLLAGDVRQVRETSSVLSAGTEVAIHASPTLTLIARAGASVVPAESDALPFTFGGAIATPHMAIDYAYHSFDDIAGAMHRLGVRWWR